MTSEQGDTLIAAVNALAAQVTALQDSVTALTTLATAGLEGLRWGFIALCCVAFYSCVSALRR